MAVILQPVGKRLLRNRCVFTEKMKFQKERYGMTNTANLSQGEKKRSMKKRSQTIFLICMLTVPFLQWLIFWLYVNLSSIVLAFQDPRTGALTFENFRLFWEGLTSPYGEIKIAVRNTLIYFATSVVVMMPLSFIIAYFVYKRIRGYKAFRIIFYLPAIVNAVAMVAAYTNFIDPKGPLGAIVKFFGGQMDPEGLLAKPGTATWTIVLYTIWTGFGANMLLFGGAMTRIPVDLLESARLDGIGAWKELTSIILPLVWSTVTTVIIVTLTGIFSASGPILLFGGGAQNETTTIAYWIFAQVYGSGNVGGSGSYNLVSCAGLCFTAVSVPVILGIRKLLERIPTMEY